MDKPIHTFKSDPEVNLQAEVWEVRSGSFHVLLKDLDANETVPLIKIFPHTMESEAKHYAKDLVRF